MPRRCSHGMRVFFYNKKIFRDNGLEVPKTWEGIHRFAWEAGGKGIKAQTMGAQSYEPMMKREHCPGKQYVLFHGRKQGL